MYINRKSTKSLKNKVSIFDEVDAKSVLAESIKRQRKKTEKFSPQEEERSCPGSGTKKAMVGKGKLIKKEIVSTADNKAKAEAEQLRIQVSKLQEEIILKGIEMRTKVKEEDAPVSVAKMPKYTIILLNNFLLF